LIAGAHVAVFDSEDQVKALRPDIAAIAKLDVPYVSVTAPAQPDNVDFVSRFFAPGAGIDEDPVTGSAHTWLAPYWSARLGKRALTARQVSKRGGTLWRQTLGDRVLISGRVSEYLEGQITLP
jgi:predicted PhzF superfamily epimerase YddE/YHI9